jgi:hypothetical protein
LKFSAITHSEEYALCETINNKISIILFINNYFS